MATAHPPLVRTRLSIMMFLEFFIWGSWGVAITGYAISLGFDASQISWLGAVPAIGAIVSPLFVGLIADRYFPAQRVLSVLHLLGGVALIVAGYQGTFLPLMVAMLLNGLAFMPTMALVNSVAFRHIPDANKFPRIAVLGTLGWIAANLLGEALGGANTPNFLLQAGIAGLVMAVYALTLPNTPPKGADAGGDVFGLGALKLFKEPTFLVFILCVFLLSIPACGYFFTLMVPMLLQRGYPGQLALGTLNQIAEIVFMFSMPWFVAKLGMKRVLMIGMAAWGLRYVCFATPGFGFALIGLLLHGFCYSFFYVGAYMYVDSRAPEEMKSSAQSLLAFMLLGVGYLLGAKGAGLMMEQYPATMTNTPTYTVVEVGDPDAPDTALPNRVIVKQSKGTEAARTSISLDNGVAELRSISPSLPRWDDPGAKDSIWRFLNLSKPVTDMRKTPEQRAMALEENQIALFDTLDTDKDDQVSRQELEAAATGGKTGPAITITNATDGPKELRYSTDELTATFDKIRNSNPRSDADSVVRAHWLAAVLDRDLLSQVNTDDDDESISEAEIQAVADAGVYVGGVTYSRDDLALAFAGVRSSLELEKDASLQRKDILEVQSCKWWNIWMFPAIGIFVVLGIFAVAFREKQE